MLETRQHAQLAIHALSGDDPAEDVRLAAPIERVLPRQHDVGDSSETPHVHLRTVVSQSLQDPPPNNLRRSQTKSVSCTVVTTRTSTRGGQTSGAMKSAVPRAVRKPEPLSKCLLNPKSTTCALHVFQDTITRPNTLGGCVLTLQVVCDLALTLITAEGSSDSRRMLES